MDYSNTDEPVYNEEYAKRYNDIWGDSEKWNPLARQHIDTFRSLLNENTKWLDAGCGTGYFLSSFPEIERAGFDKSEPMLEQARQANPGIELKKNDLRDRITEWEGKWDLVSCTGHPWTYLPLLSDIHTAVSHLAAYTNNEGKLFLTFFDITDFTENSLPQFYTSSAIPEDQFFVNGVVWSLNENGAEHKDMILPNFDQWIRWFSECFMRIEILHWNCKPHLRISHRSFLCSIKRKQGDTEPSRIIEHPVLEPSKISEHPVPDYNQQEINLPVSKPWELRFWKRLFARGSASRKN